MGASLDGTEGLGAAPPWAMVASRLPRLPRSPKPCRAGVQADPSERADNPLSDQKNREAQGA